MVLALFARLFTHCCHAGPPAESVDVNTDESAVTMQCSLKVTVLDCGNLQMLYICNLPLDCYFGNQEVTKQLSED